MKTLHTVIRQLLHQKFNTLLHIIGLTLGMSVCLLIGLFLRYELNFDTYHEKAENIYRINSVWTDTDKKSYFFLTPQPLAEAVRSGVSGLNDVVLVHPQWNSVVEINPQNIFAQENVLIAQPELLNFFKVDFVKGNGNLALRSPYKAVLTESTAKKFFGNEDPLGKTFKYKNEWTITVSGVIRDLPPNTSLPASMILSYVEDDKFLDNGPNTWYYGSTNWSWLSTYTYVIMPGAQGAADVERQLQAIADKNINSDPQLPKNLRCSFQVQPLKEIHFDTEMFGGSHLVKAVNKSWLLFFGSIAVAVLVLACINFLNLSTAQAMNRAKEVGIRKSVGAARSQLVFQFLLEAWTVAAISGILAVGIVAMSISPINNLIGKEIEISVLQRPELLGALVAGIIITGLLAGLYPSWIISQFNPAVILKSSATTAGNRGSLWLRRGLVVLQFGISASLLVAVLLISRQVEFMRGKNLGFDKDNVLTVKVKNAEKVMEITDALRKIPGVKDFSFSNAAPSGEGHWGTGMSPTNADDPNQQLAITIYGDDRFAPMYGLRLLAGRLPGPDDVVKEQPQKTPADGPGNELLRVLVNEKLVQALHIGSPAAAIGTHFWFGMKSGNAEIIGVVADFNTNSLHGVINPTIIMQLPEVYMTAGIKLEQGADLQATIQKIEVVWRNVFPDGVFEYNFLDEQIDALYKSESRLYMLFRIFAGIALVISCLGLWGLATFSSQQRVKEIGIRKVMGASVSSVVMLLLGDFLVLVVLAFVIAAPFTYYGMNEWLKNFQFRIGIGWQPFVVAALALLIISFLTVSVQSIRAALTNPAKSLRHD